jgi:hypothetical protein
MTEPVGWDLPERTVGGHELLADEPVEIGGAAPAGACQVMTVVNRSLSSRWM